MQHPCYPTRGKKDILVSYGSVRRRLCSDDNDRLRRLFQFSFRSTWAFERRHHCWKDNIADVLIDLSGFAVSRIASVITSKKSKLVLINGRGGNEPPRRCRGNRVTGRPVIPAAVFRCGDTWEAALPRRMSRGRYAGDTKGAWIKPPIRSRLSGGENACPMCHERFDVARGRDPLWMDRSSRRCGRILCVLLLSGMLLGRDARGEHYCSRREIQYSIFACYFLDARRIRLM